MRTVHIGIRHNNHFVIPQFCNVKIVADARAQRRNDGG